MPPFDVSAAQVTDASGGESWEDAAFRISSISLAQDGLLCAFT
jgi:hypothetical protein